jgi:hypothetical protein
MKKTWKPGDKVRLLGEGPDHPVMVVKVHLPSEPDSEGHLMELIICNWRAKDGTPHEERYAPEQLIDAV